MPADLEMESSWICETWQAASDPDIRVRWAAWPELAVLASAQRGLLHASDGSETLNSLTWSAYRAVRMLSCSPCQPETKCVGLSALIKECTNFCKEHPNHSLNVKVLALKNAASELRAMPSPVAAAVEAEVARYSVREGGPWIDTPEAVVVVRPDLVQATRDFLQSTGLVADVRSPMEVQRTHHKGVIVCGSISFAFASPWLDSHQAIQVFGWLLTAPPGDEVIVVETDVSRNDLDGVWLLGDSHHPSLDVSRGLIAPPVRPGVLLPPSASRSAASPDFSFSPEQKRAAKQVLLASGRSVYYSDEEGPRPRRMIVSESGIDTENRLDLLDLHINDLVLIRVAGSDHDEIVRRANAFLRDDGWTQAKLSEVRELVQGLKNMLGRALSEDSEPEVWRRMEANGLTLGYARALSRNLLNEWYIAPRRDHFEQVVQAIGATDLLNRREEIFQLRSAHQLAGKAISKDLDALLSGNYRWYDEVVTDGFALLRGGTLGDLLVEVVMYPAEEGYEVPVSYLGRAVDGNPPQPVSVAALRSGA